MSNIVWIVGQEQAITETTWLKQYAVEGDTVLAAHDASGQFKAVCRSNLELELQAFANLFVNSTTRHTARMSETFPLELFRAEEPDIKPWKIVSHSYKNGGDDSAKPSIRIQGNLVEIVADVDCDADGSPRAKEIDPSVPGTYQLGQTCTSLGRTEGKFNGWKGTDDLEYVNSETVPYYVVPSNFKAVTGIEIKAGDVAQVKHKNKIVYAIFADEGPKDIIGEGSIALIEALGGNPWNGNHTKIVRGIPHGVIFLVQVGSANLNKCVDFDSIQDYGESLFGVRANCAKKPVAM